MDGEEEEEFPRSCVGITIYCHPDVEAELVSALQIAADEILEGYTDDEIYDWGIG